MRFPLGIEALSFPLDAKLGELVPWLIDGHAPEFQHRLSARISPLGLVLLSGLLALVGVRFRRRWPQ